MRRVQADLHSHLPDLIGPVSVREGTVPEQAPLPEAKAHDVSNHPHEACGTEASRRLVGEDKGSVIRNIAMAIAYALSIRKTCS